MMELTLEKIFTIFLSLMISVALLIPVYSVTVKYFAVMKTEIDVSNFISLTNESISTAYKTQSNLSDIEIFYPGNITIKVENDTLVFLVTQGNRTKIVSFTYNVKIKLLRAPTIRGNYLLSVFFIDNSDQEYISISYNNASE